MRRLPCLLLLVILTAASALPVEAGVILNTLEGGATSAPGLSGKVGGLFSAKGGNTEEISLEVGGRLDWQGEAQRLRLQVTADYEEASGTETERNIVAHLRHSRQLAEHWSSVVFVQLRHNPFQYLKRRWLLGAGPRLDLVHTGQDLVAIGATPMLEIERVEGRDQSLMRGRLSTFFQLSRRLNPTTRLTGTAFYQPLFADFASVRAVGDLALVVDISGSLELKTGYSVEHNSEPPAGVKKMDWSTYLGLTYGF